MTTIATSEINPSQEANVLSETTPELLGNLMLTGEYSDNFAQYESRATRLTGSKIFQTPEEVSERFGLNKEQAEAAINNAEAMEPTAKIAVRMPVYAFEDMMDSGGTYKTVFETGHTRGHGGERKTTDTIFFEVRNRINDRLGITPKEGEPSIVHGYLDNSATLEYESDARAYGDITLVLKPDVIKRSTFTIGDSLKASSGPTIGIKDACIAKEATRINWYTYTRAPKKERAPYIEAQIIGGVSFADVESVTITFSDSSEQTDRSGKIENLPAMDISTDKLTEILDTIAKFNAAMPIQIEIPTFHENTFPVKAVLGLAQQYPNITFVGVIDPGKSGVYEVHDPYKASFRADQLRQAKFESIAEDVISRSNDYHSQAQQRKNDLESWLSEHVDEVDLNDKIANRIRFVIAGGD